ncbi:polysaccharide deacetylase family protein [Falsiporphyromonas endometrii]|uniref:Polysaccharide deacetylase family protein n=1 Tax=Falsiporphyromonas endometrii TaxID=1387297 RepID=A0ABV9K601_9PORP
MNAEVVNYIIRFMVNEDVAPDDLENLVGYTSDPERMKGYKIVILPSPFFKLGVYGTPASYPELPLSEFEGVPLLFGSPSVYQSDEGPLIIEADLVASSFFVLSRYEEIFRRSIRDVHGRFPGKESLPYKAGFIEHPIVDEYGVILRRYMRQCGIDVKEPPRYFSHVNLTHDIDEPFAYRGFRSFLRAIVKERKSPFEAFRLAYSDPKHDKYYTFDKFLEWNKLCREQLGISRCDTIFFFKSNGTHKLDMPQYKLNSLRYKPLMDMVEKREVKIGLHCSYSSSLRPERIKQEKIKLQRSVNCITDLSRHHYLAAREPEDMISLINSGIRHDYTMGYADVVGFRLGTCRPVRFIRPSTRVLTDLVLHPLMMMDCTFTKYMNLSEEEAEKKAKLLVRSTAQYHGELNILWHNVSLSKALHPWLCRLYRVLLRYLTAVDMQGRGEAN